MDGIRPIGNTRPNSTRRLIEVADYATAGASLDSLLLAIDICLAEIGLSGDAPAVDHDHPAGGAEIIPLATHRRRHRNNRRHLPYAG